MATEATHTEGDNGGEADAFEKQNHVEKSDTGVACVGDGGTDEDDAACQEDQKDMTRPEEVHQSDAGETADGKGALSAGEEASSDIIVGVGTGFDDVVDEEAVQSQMM